MKEISAEDHSISKGLLAVLSVMSPRQRDHFEQYLSFEPFESNKKLCELFRLIQLHLFQKRKPKTKWKDALEKVGINPSQFNKLQSFLHQRLDKYLAIQQIMSHPQRYHSYTLEAYTNLKVDYPNIEKKWRQLLKKLQKDGHSIEHFQQLSNLEHFAIRARMEGGSKVSGSYFEEMHATIDQNYILSKLKYLCASVNEATILNQPFPDKAIQALKGVINSQEQPLTEFGQAYYAVFELLEHPSEPIAKYNAALEKIVNHLAYISSEDQFDLFHYLLNLSFRRVDIGQNEFGQLVANIYEHLINGNLILVNGVIPARTFKNIVSMNCKLNKFAWCLDFIEAYRKGLPSEDQELLPQYCQGLVDFYSGNYLDSTAIFKSFIKNHHEDHFLGFESRNLLLKSFFHRFEQLDAQEYEELQRMIESFRMNVRRNNKLSQFHIKSYFNFLHYFKILLRHIEINGSKQPFPQDLQKEIEALEFVTNKNWLLDVIKEKN